MPAETHSRRETTPAEVRRVVFENAAEILGLDPDEIDDETDLPGDTGANIEIFDLCREDLAERTVDAEAEEAALEWRRVGDVVFFFASYGAGAEDREEEVAAVAGQAPRLTDLESALGCAFTDTDLLVAALRHRSHVAEFPDGESNERLEFLGDAVLSIVVTDHLYRTWPDKAEGPLAKARAAVVSAEYLSELAVQLGLGAHLRLGRGEAASGGREKPSILADALEAVIGAVYMDGGIDMARAVVLPLVVDRLAAAVTGEGAKDFKTRLQEYTSQRMSSLPRYEVEAFGPDHAKEFTATVEVAGRVVGSGHGRSKKQAEQAAARSAWGVVVAAQPDRGGAEGDEADGAAVNQEANGDHA